jgi:outer membrane protein TolC
MTLQTAFRQAVGAVRARRVPCAVGAGVVAALMSQRGEAEELTAASSADRAVQASYEAAAARSAQRAAEARVSQASYAFLPKVSVSGRYVRLSDFTPPPLFPFAIAATDAPAGAPL